VSSNPDRLGKLGRLISRIFMIYLLPSVLILVSYLFGVYFAHQETRGVIERPLMYRGELTLLTLTLLLGWVPLVIGIYLAFQKSRLIFSLLLIMIRFILLPTLFNNRIKNFMNERGF